MNIVVCLKQVPGTTEVKIDPVKNTLIRQGIKNIVNPFDTYALEEGVRLKERFGGKVTALSMGPPQAIEILREAITLGADDTVLLSDAAFAGADTWATSYTLGKAVQKLGDIDLVICGRQTIDGDTGQVGPELSEMLGVPFIAYVSKVEDIKNGSSTRTTHGRGRLRNNRSKPACRHNRGERNQQAAPAFPARPDESKKRTDSHMDGTGYRGGEGESWAGRFRHTGCQGLLSRREHATLRCSPAIPWRR